MPKCKLFAKMLEQHIEKYSVIQRFVCPETNGRSVWRTAFANNSRSTKLSGLLSVMILTWFEMLFGLLSTTRFLSYYVDNFASQRSMSSAISPQKCFGSQSALVELDCKLIISIHVTNRAIKDRLATACLYCSEKVGLLPLKVLTKEQKQREKT